MLNSKPAFRKKLLLRWSLVAFADKQIASIFKELELIEKYGSGVRRAIETCVAYGLPEQVSAVLRVQY